VIDGNRFAKEAELDFKRNLTPGDRFYGFIPVFEAALFPSKPPSQYDAACFKVLNFIELTNKIL
jgi:hypothetical protein